MEERIRYEYRLNIDGRGRLLPTENARRKSQVT
jgi:hypothetical protein